MAKEPATKRTNSDVEAFLDSIPAETRRADARTSCALMTEVTGEQPVLWGAGLVGFGGYDYRSDSGCQGTSALASFQFRPS